MSCQSACPLRIKDSITGLIASASEESSPAALKAAGFAGVALRSKDKAINCHFLVAPTTARRFTASNEALSSARPISA
ncbi:MAG: hypothetical protein EBX62_09980 [Betaproteobacteria bacterium]|nr:hypothetical protein [Betaproteobacteria bacterium]